MNIQDSLERKGVELDQRMQRALEITASDDMTDAHLFLALYRSNSILTRYLNIAPEALSSISNYNFDYKLLSRVPANKARIRRTSVVGAMTQIINARAGDTLGVKDFVSGLLRECEEVGDNYARRPFTIDMLCMLTAQRSSIKVSEVPGIIALLEALAKESDGTEDYQFILTFNGDEIVFRVVSVLDDYVERLPSGVLHPRRALLTHFQDKFGGFTEDEIRELEEMINDAKAREEDFQRFFEYHPHFFRKWDYREVHSQVYLHRPEGSLIPDFILTDRELQKAALIELKLPKPQLIRRQKNRERFSSAVIEARSQLLTYRDWFRSPENRKSLRRQLGMEVYEPNLAAIIGRSTDFHDEFDRQRLSSSLSDVEIVTYDEIFTYAKRRRLLLEF